MQHTVKHEEKNQVLITVTLSVEEVDKALKHAAEHAAEGMDIPGFRKGTAPYEIVKQRVTEERLLEMAAEEMVRDTLATVLLNEQLETAGSPEFGVEKMAPGNEFVYTARMSLMPMVQKLADYKGLALNKADTKPTEAEYNQAKEDLLKMRREEKKADADRAVTLGDKAVVNLGMKKDGVVIEGGEAKDHGIYTDEPHYIPGFVDAIIGMKQGETRTFTLPFPEDHYQKHLAGSNVDYTVELKEIFTLDLPNWDDAFAKTLGLDSATLLEEKLNQNLSAEKERGEVERLDREMLELIAKNSTFDELSDLLVSTEVEKMVQELQHWVEERGMQWSEYAKSIGKSLAEMKLDFTPQAIIRLKVALVITAIAKAEKITADEAELDTEIDRIAAGLGENADAKHYVYSPEFRERLATQQRNRRVVEYLRTFMVK